MARHLFIVSRNHERLYDYLLERFRDDQNVAVILDRRRGERRGLQVAPSTEDRRIGERRRRLQPDDDLSLRSHIIITVNS